MLIFTHIPKTAGTALIEEMKASSIKAIQYQKGGVEMSSDAYIKAKETIANGEVELIHGHNGFGVHKELKLPLKKVRYMTLLRDPIQRVASFYDFMRNHRQGHPLFKPIMDCNSISDMMELGIEQIDNCAVRMLSGEMNGSDKAKSVAYGKVNIYQFKTALDNLNKYFTFVGVQEYYQEFLEYLLAVKIITKINNFYENETAERTDLSDEDIKAIEKYNKWDIKLYEEVLSKWK